MVPLGERFCWSATQIRKTAKENVIIKGKKCTPLKKRVLFFAIAPKGHCFDTRFFLSAYCYVIQKIFPTHPGIYKCYETLRKYRGPPEGIM